MMKRFSLHYSILLFSCISLVGCATGSGGSQSCIDAECNLYCTQQGYGWGECLQGACLCHYTPLGLDGGWHPWHRDDAGDSCGGCPWGRICCDGVCIPVEEDPMNCGACGRVCKDGEQCINGWCLCGGVTSCYEGVEKCCDGICVNILYDFTNCGDCGVQCEDDTGPECLEGHCVCPELGEPNPRVCAGTYEDMCCPRTFLASGGCKNLGNDRAHCGSCGHACDFFNGEICFMGGCVLGQN